MDLQIGSWNNSIKGIDDYALFITSKNLLEFKIERKLWNTEAKIIALEKWATRSTYVWGKNNSRQNNDRVTTNSNKEALTSARLIEEGKVNKAIKILEKANKGGIPPLSDETVEILQQKHPEASEASDEMLLKETP